MSSVHWPNAIPADPENPDLVRDGILVVSYNLEWPVAYGSLIIAVRDLDDDDNPQAQDPEVIAALRADVLATITVHLNNFASDDFIAGLVAGVAYTILQPRPAIN
jgi:hypothetical protein